MVEINQCLLGGVRYAVSSVKVRVFANPTKQMNKQSLSCHVALWTGDVIFIFLSHWTVVCWHSRCAMHKEVVRFLLHSLLPGVFVPGSIQTAEKSIILFKVLVHVLWSPVPITWETQRVRKKVKRFAMERGVGSEKKMQRSLFFVSFLNDCLLTPTTALSCLFIAVHNKSSGG